MLETDGRKAFPAVLQRGVDDEPGFVEAEIVEFYASDAADETVAAVAADDETRRDLAGAIRPVDCRDTAVADALRSHERMAKTGRDTLRCRETRAQRMLERRLMEHGRVGPAGGRETLSGLEAHEQVAIPIAELIGRKRLARF